MVKCKHYKTDSDGHIWCNCDGEITPPDDENIQELREVIFDCNSSKNYQNKKIREWFVRHLI